MFFDDRINSVDAWADTVRVSLVETTAYRCPRCGVQCTVSVRGCPIEDEPVQVCGRCLRERRRKVALEVVLPPEYPGASNQ